MSRRQRMADAAEHLDTANVFVRDAARALRDAGEADLADH
jgi:hypothetical protein